MRKFLFTIIVLIPVLVSAQIQNGYVRTKGTSTNRYGSPIAQAKINIKGLNNSFVTAANGTFNFNLGGGKKQYSVASVTKAGYSLLSPLASSYNVGDARLEIVMQSRAERLAEEARITEKMEANITKSYETKMSRLQKERETLQNELASEKQNADALKQQIYTLEEQIAALDQQYQKRNDLIDKMVKEYVNLDYATLDDRKAQLCAFIENGELERADSLLNTIDINAKMDNIKALRTDIKEKREQVNTEEKVLQQNIDEACMYWRGKYDVAVQNMQYDSAAVYVKELADLDTANYDNAVECANFNACRGEIIESIYGLPGYMYYQGIFKLAEEYYLRAIRLLDDKVIENPNAFLIESALMRHNIAVVHEKLLRKEDSVKDLTEAIRILIQSNNTCVENYFPILAKIYEHLGVDYLNQDSTDMAKEVFQKAFEINKRLAEESPKLYNYNLASVIFDIANINAEEGYAEEAEKGYVEASAIITNKITNKPEYYKSDLALIQENLALTHIQLKKYRLAEKAYFEAFKYQIHEFQRRPDYYQRNLKLLIYNISMFYSEYEEKESLNYSYQYLLEAIKEQVKTSSNYFNEIMAAILYEISEAHRDIETPNYKYAINDCQLELYINKVLAEKDNTYMYNYAVAFWHLGICYDEMDNKDEALSCYRRSLDILEEESRRDPEFHSNLIEIIQKRING